MMTVGELKGILEEYDDEREVILATDEEGNGFYQLQLVEPYKFRKHYRRTSGDIGLETLLPCDIEDGYTEEDVIEDGTFALVFWP